MVEVYFVMRIFFLRNMVVCVMVLVVLFVE